MKVLFIASDNNCTSGAFLSMVKLNEILNNEYKIETMIILPVKGDGYKLLEEKGIKYRYVKSYNWVIPLEKRNNKLFRIKILIKKIINYFAIRKIIQSISTDNFDIVHINTTYPYIGAKVALKKGLPFIWHFREYLEEDQNRCIWTDKNYAYKLMSKAQKIVCVSNDLCDKYKDHFDKGKVIAILNGIDIDKFYKPQKTIFKNELVTLIYGGGYSFKKGIYEFASMLSLLLRNGKYNFQVLFIGKVPDKYKAYLNKLGLGNMVKYLGYQKDVSQWYEVSDIAFTCSACEGFGRKTVEAMLCGTLVIAANKGGTLDIVNNNTGLLYNQGDCIDLFNKCIYAIQNKEKMQEIANNGRKFAREKLNAYRNAEKIVNVYDEILNIRR